MREDSSDRCFAHWVVTHDNARDASSLKEERVSLPEKFSEGKLVGTGGALGPLLDSSGGGRFPARPSGDAVFTLIQKIIFA